MIRSLRHAAAALLLATTATFAQDAPKTTPEPLPPATHHDVSYGPHERHKLDLWAAQTPGPAPLLVFIHGGGWNGGDKGQLLPKLLAAMLKNGVSVASINYRYSSIAPLPAPVHDAARAVQFLRTKAGEWKLDPARIGAYGVSAGGCSALWLAYHDDLAKPKSADPVERESTRLQVAVGIAPQTSLEPDVVFEWIGPNVTKHPMIVRAVGARNWDEARTHSPAWLALLREFSPINHVSPGDPPVLVAFNTFSELPATSAGAAIHHAIFGQKLKEKADAAGVRCVLRIEDKKPGADIPKPEAFLLESLLRK